MASDKEFSLGEFLRHEREKRCITIEQVASATKIGVRTLHLLEEDQYVELPAKPFIRGFVTSYCRFIGLDPKEVLARFDIFMSSKTAERPNRESGHSGYAFEKKDGEQQGRTILMIAIVSFVILGGLAVLFFKPSLHHHRKSHIDKLRAGHGTSNAVLVAAQPSPTPSSLPSSAVLPMAISSSPASTRSPMSSPPQGVTEAPSPLPSIIADSSQSQPSPLPSHSPGANPNDPLDSGVGLSPSEIHHKISAKILADVWVRYQVDDRPVRKFIVRKGRQLILRAREKVWIQVSNPNSLTFKYNGKGPETVSQIESQKLVHGVTTLAYPDELNEKIEENLKNERPLPSTPDPASD